jgi:TonB family protein
LEDAVKALCIAALFAASYAVDSAQVAPMHPCKPHENGACATNPKIVRHVEPEFSEHGRKKKINGTVVLTFTVLPDGTTADIIVTRSLEKSLDEQAIKRSVSGASSPAPTRTNLSLSPFQPRPHSASTDHASACALAGCLLDNLFRTAISLVDAASC